MLFNLKYCGDCIKAGITCFPVFNELGKPVRDTFCCEVAYTVAMGVFYRRGEGRTIFKEREVGTKLNHL